MVNPSLFNNNTYPYILKLERERERDRDDYSD